MVVYDYHCVYGAFSQPSVRKRKFAKGHQPCASVCTLHAFMVKVASLSLFHSYYFGHCCDELAACIPPPIARPRSTRQATFAHNYCVELANARINRFSDGFFPLLPAFGTLSLLLYFRLPSTFLPSKGRSITTLGTKWHDFFYYPF